MPTIKREAKQQRYGKSDAERLFRVYGTDSYAEALSAIFGGETPMAPAQWGDFSLVDYDARELKKSFWEVKALYGSVATEVLQGVVNVSFDIGHAMETRKFALGPGASYYAAGTLTIDLGGAIGQDGEGVGVPSPRLAFQLRTKMTTAQVTDAYLATIFQGVGKINVAAWRGFKAQELLFLGARLDQLNALEWDCTFLMQAEYEKTNFTVGQGPTAIAGVSKKGWQYLWVYTLPKTITVKTGLRKPREVAAVARVEDVHETFNFNLLSIPGATNNVSGMLPITIGP